MANYAIEVNSLTKSFTLHHTSYRTLKQKVVGLIDSRKRLTSEKLDALVDINFRLKRGGSLALLGHNGSGKSTLLQLLAGVIQPTAGKIKTNGRIVPLIELGVGFHPELTGQENVYLNASLLGASNKETRKIFNEIVEFSELQKFIDTPVKHYSSGMYMRLAFSVAVHTRPDILLADEILTVGDKEYQEKCHERIKILQEQGMTLILVTHAEGLAEKFCNQFIKLDHGKIIDQGHFKK